MRPSPSLRSAILAGALSLVASLATAVPAVAQSDTQGTPIATIARVGVDRQRLEVRAGGRVFVIGRVRPAAAGLIAALQVSRGGRWRTVDRDRTSASGRYVLRDRIRHAGSARARVVVRSAGGSRVLRRLGRVRAYRAAYASWYGPGLYGNRLGCGGTLTASRLGVAHKTLPCGTRVSLRHGGRTVTVRVIDRGPYVGGREYDLTAATARRLGFSGHGVILSTR